MTICTLLNATLTFMHERNQSQSHRRCWNEKIVWIPQAKKMYIFSILPFCILLVEFIKNGKHNFHVISFKSCKQLAQPVTRSGFSECIAKNWWIFFIKLSVVILPYNANIWNIRCMFKSSLWYILQLTLLHTKRAASSWNHIEYEAYWLATFTNLNSWCLFTTYDLEVPNTHKLFSSLYLS